MSFNDLSDKQKLKYYRIYYHNLFVKCFNSSHKLYNYDRNSEEYKIKSIENKILSDEYLIKYEKCWAKINEYRKKLGMPELPDDVITKSDYDDDIKNNNNDVITKNNNNVDDEEEEVYQIVKEYKPKFILLKKEYNESELF